MAGHSKWANIKHRKAAQDKKRGKIWTKCSKAIIVAAKNGGPDPSTNLSLRYAIDEAKYANMPKDTIQRAVEKGAGAAGGDSFENITYEGYGPAGVAVIIDTLTDNNTRTVNDIRNVFKKAGGSLGNAGSVAYMFDSRGRFFVPAGSIGEDALMEVAIEAGAEDVEPGDADEDGSQHTVLCQVTDFAQVKTALEGAGVEISEAELTKLPQNIVNPEGDDAKKIFAMIEALEDNDDVQKVYTNAELPEDVYA